MQTKEPKWSCFGTDTGLGGGLWEFSPGIVAHKLDGLVNQDIAVFRYSRLKYNVLVGVFFQASEEIDPAFAP